MKYGCVLLKLSGESLMGENGYGIDRERLEYFAGEIIDAVQTGSSMGIVIGGGNIFRGIQGTSSGMNRVQGDYMGMLATLINSIALQATLEEKGVPTVLMSGLVVEGLTLKATRTNALKALREGKIVIFAGGTGNPYFTTDTAAALRAAEIGAQVLLKGTRVDGVYTADPEKSPDAVRLPEVTFDEAILKQYNIMDITAFTMCRENSIPIRVFDIQCKGNLKKIMLGEPIGTRVML